MYKFIERWLYKPKYVVVHLKRKNNDFEEVKRQIFKSIESFEASNSGKFLCNSKQPTYSKNNLRIYFVEYKEKNSFSFNERPQPMNLEEIDLIVSNNLIKQISSGLMDKSKILFMYVGIGLFIGLLIGLFIMNIISQNKIKQLYEDWIESQPPIINMLRGLTWMIRK